MSIDDGVVVQAAYTTPVPKAKNDPTRIYSEYLADSVIVLDTDAMHYHSLNRTAADVWTLCDGRRSVRDIASELQLQGIDAPEEAVALAVTELGDAELLQAAPPLGESRVHRRRVLKLAAAGLIGAGALPLVESITVPDAASAATVNLSCCTSPCTVGVCVGIDVSAFIAGCTGTVSVCANVLDPDGTLAAVLACAQAACSAG